MTDIFIVAAFLLFWFLSLFRREQSFKNMFGSLAPLPWWVTGFSLTVIAVNVTYAVLLAGLAFSGGFQELWWVFIGNIGIGFTAFIFSHYWARSGVNTDNQIVKLRFSGRASNILQTFRAGYVGVLVFPLLCAQMTVAFAGFLSAFSGLSYSFSLLITIAILLLNVTRTTFNTKVRMDVFMGLLFTAIILIISLWLLISAGGPHQLGSAITERTGPVRILPDSGGIFSRADFLVLILVAWWSSYLMDGAGLQAQRFIHMNSRRDLIKGALFQGIAMAVITFFLLIIVSAALYFYPEMINGEQALFRLFAEELPPGLRALSLIAIGIAYLTTVEAFINLSSSYIMIDLLDYDRASFTDSKKRWHTYISIVLISLFIVCIAFFFESVEQIFRFILVITAGVGPVFLLRWWWWRINAWSQLSAMLSSLIYAVLYEFAYEEWTAFRDMMDTAAFSLGMQPFSIKVLVLTAIVMATWLSVTFLTSPDDTSHLKAFYKRVRPHGWWKPVTGQSSRPLLKTLATAILAGFTLLSMHFIFFPLFFGVAWHSLVLLVVAGGMLWILVKRAL
ncbi:MAG: hypothetical protein LAT84_04560 [Balneolia bacterium]|nr:hypothetical protein [Balneolia bacterium]